MRLLNALQRLSAVRLWLISVGVAIVLTECTVSVMGLLLVGRVTPDYLLTGLVASFLAASLVSALILFLLQQVRELNADLARRVETAVETSREKDHQLLAQARDAALGELTRSISHHWRQPLNALGILVSNLEDAFEHGELDRTYLEKACTQARGLIRELSTTIDRFRALSSTQQTPRVFDAAQMVREALMMFEGERHEWGIAVTLETDPDVPVEGVPAEFAQAVLHLLTNAREALSEAGVRAPHIGLRVEATEGEARVTLRDNAGGIPPDVLPRIFDPYFSTKTNHPGLGLFMARSLVKSGLNGRLEVNTGAEGTTFLLACPLAAPRSGKL